MPQPIAETADRLETLLKLRSIPFGMKMFENRADMEAIPKIRRPKSVHTLDQAVAQAARLGWTVGITSEDLVGAQCRAVVGLGRAKDDAWKSGKHMTGVWFSTLEDAGAHQAAMHCVEDGKYEALAVAPLAQRSTLESFDLVIVDDPSFVHGSAWIRRARRAGARAVSVHDGGPVQDADLVICPGLGQRPPRTVARTLTGTQFYLLDQRIAAARRTSTLRPANARPRVVVALGGGQHVRRVAQRLVDAIVARGAVADIVVAAGFTRTPQRPLRHATWLTAQAGLVEALSSADVAVVAGGVTLYEACALGVPAVGLAVVAAQRRAIRAFARERALVDAGAGAAAIDSAAAGVARLLNQPSLRTRTAARARQLVDGRGVDRVARSIRALVARGGSRG